MSGEIKLDKRAPIEMGNQYYHIKLSMNTTVNTIGQKKRCITGMRLNPFEYERLSIFKLPFQDFFRQIFHIHSAKGTASH